jgi:anhydro-N-acetylmuramic acid kinase
MRNPAGGTSLTKRLKALLPLNVAGIMSGTSGDGIDIAIVHIAPKARGRLSISLLAHGATPFSKSLRAAVMAAQDAQQTSTAELARLHWRLGLAYADALSNMLKSTREKIDLVGCHGQTIYHQSALKSYAGARFSCTWQIGEMAPLARAAGVPVVSNFRPADMIVGGQGAPLVPLLDEVLYRDAKRTRILLNIGGIANLTIVPPYGAGAPVIAFDTGPGNMVMDALMQQLFAKPYDRGGRTAARGAVHGSVVNKLRLAAFFSLPPPRSAGREQFGARYAASLLHACRQRGATDFDGIATATALTAFTIADAIERFATLPDTQAGCDLIVAGGGAKNPVLLRQLEVLLAPRRIRLLTTESPELGTPLPVEAKEAAAFALLAYMSLHGRPGNVPSATGAQLAAVLGQVTCA